MHPQMTMGAMTASIVHEINQPLAAIVWDGEAVGMDDPAGVVVTLDWGTGIQPFFTTKSNGMGMGLSTCRSIVDARGGAISAAPAHPFGSIFQIVLPSQPEVRGLPPSLPRGIMLEGSEAGVSPLRL